MLEVESSVIRGMVAQGILSAPAGNRPGPSKLLPAAEIQRFAEQYVSATVLGRRCVLPASVLDFSRQEPELHFLQTNRQGTGLSRIRYRIFSE